LQPMAGLKNQMKDETIIFKFCITRKTILPELVIIFNHY